MLFYISLFLFILLCVIMSLVILVQESKSMGLGASFGGDVGNSIFGTSTADVLKKFTTWLVVLFFASSIFMSLWTSSVSRTTAKSAVIMEQDLD